MVDTIHVKLFHQYPLIIDNKKTNNTLSDSIHPLIKTGRINIINPNTFTTNISITIGSSQFFLSLKANSTESFYLPEGDMVISVGYLILIQLFYYRHIK